MTPRTRDGASDDLRDRLVDAYRRRGRDLFAFAYRLVDGPDAAEDVVHDAFVRLLDGRCHIDARRGDLDMLLFGLDGSMATLGERQTTGHVSEGDVIRLDVFEQPQTGRRLTDVIRVVELSPSSVRRMAASRAVQSSNPPTLTLAQFELKRDGAVLARVGGLATGHTVMLGLVGRGTVIFSAQPHPDAPSSGMATVAGGTLRFWLDGQEYEYVSADPIGPEGLTSLWIYVIDRDVPDPSMRDVFKGPVWVGASGSVEGALAMFRRRDATP